MAYKITDFDNYIPVSGTYPFGDIKDNDGTGNGTSLNRKNLADIFQFFQGIMSLGGITPNSLPDNETNGSQLPQALLNIISGSTTVHTFNSSDYSGGTYLPDPVLPLQIIKSGSTVTIQGQLHNSSPATVGIDDYLLRIPSTSMRPARQQYAMFYADMTSGHSMVDKVGFMIITVDGSIILQGSKSYFNNNSAWLNVTFNVLA